MTTLITLDVRPGRKRTGYGARGWVVDCPHCGMYGFLRSQFITRQQYLEGTLHDCPEAPEEVA